jgi:PAS domain S-box-containing protein
MTTNKQVKILMVDDRKENLQALEVILSNEEYVCVKANSGKEALKILLHEEDFAIILMDVQMPVMNGFETAELIRSSETFKHVPIIFLTANTDTPEDIFKGYQTGAVDYMIKPLSADILKAKVSVFAELYKKNKELTLQTDSVKKLNDQLKQQSRYVRSILEAGLDPLLIINTQGRITDMNEALEKVTGLTREHITGTHFSDHFTKPIIANQVYLTTFEKGDIADYALTFKNKDGGQKDVICNGSVYKDSFGNILGAVIVAREKVTSKYSRSLIEASLDPLITINSEGKITDMNEVLTKITGLSRERIIGTDFFGYFTETKKAHELYREAFAKGSIVNYPLTIKGLNDKLTDVLCNGSVYKDKLGNILGTVIVARDITAQKQFEAELIEAKTKAEEAVRSKQQFLSNMSHEIRTPMNAIIGFTKVVLKTDLNEKQKEYINAIKSSGDQLIVLINDILDLAKVDAGKMTFEQKPFKLRASISNMVHLFGAKMQEKNLTFKEEFDDSIPEVLMGDAVRLHQVIINLIGNAIKFTPKGHITLGVRQIDQKPQTSTIEFTVSDTGIGIPEDKLDKIFDNFQQATSETTRLYGGTGLGLSIVKQLVEAQGGKVWVKSKQGEGSTFGFTLSFKRTKSKMEAEHGKTRRVEKSKQRFKILVVEDVKLNQLLIKTLLEEFGYDQDIAENGKIAVEKCEQNSYDLILMDLHMPEMNGFEATEQIRTKLRSNVPIIALTADVTTVDVERCRAVGMTDYISKPIDDKLLFRKISHYVKRDHAPENGNAKTNGTAKIKENHYHLINFDYLNELTVGKPERMLVMMNAYLEETPKLLNAMREGIASKTWKEVGTAAHSLIPSFTMVGIGSEYETMAREIQELTGQKKLSDEDERTVRDLFAKIENVCSLAMQELQQEVSTHHVK